MERAASLEDLNKTLELISPAVCFTSSRVSMTASQRQPGPNVKTLTAPDSCMALFSDAQVMRKPDLTGPLYDIHSFADSAFLDILQQTDGEEPADHLLQHLLAEFQKCMQSYQSKDSCASKQHFIKLSRTFHGRIASYFEHMTFSTADNTSTPFVWEPCKGRTRYFDMIAMEIICKISQGVTLWEHSCPPINFYHPPTMYPSARCGAPSVS